MNQHLKEILSSVEGSLSFTRVAAGLVIIVGCYAVLHQLWFRETVDYMGPIGLIGAGFAGKVTQRSMEGDNQSK